MSNKSAARLRQALRTVEYLHEQAPDLDIHIQVRDPKLAGGSTPALLLEGDVLYEHGWSTKPRERVPVELSEDPLAIAAERRPTPGSSRAYRRSRPRCECSRPPATTA